jgi:RNA polymerase sigma-32 factor
MTLPATPARQPARTHGPWDALERAAHAQGMLSRDEERRLAERARQGDQRAFDSLVRAHIPLVFAMAFELRAAGLPADELLSEGLLGLVKAARDFDPSRGTRLATYAAFWIRALMRSYALGNQRIVRGPSTRNARKIRGALGRTERALEQRLGVKPDAQTIALELGVPEADVEEVRAALRTRDVAYGVPSSAGGVETAATDPTPEALAIAADEQRSAAVHLSWALARLDPRARRVLQRRYLSDHESTFADLGLELGVSRERVRQIELQAKQEVRQATASLLG